MSSKERGDIVGILIYALLIFAFAILCGVLWRQDMNFLSGFCCYMTVKILREFWKMLHTEDDEHD